jgi:hypothetical protein
MMSDERLMVAEAVIAGQIPEYHLSQAEIDEIFERACNAATEKLLIEAEARGCSVFWGVEDGDTLQ